ncbi:hypothetical protein WFZ85_04285 [Flavobacterium sp. j3]|uniref:Uncharacterized protein n=1 Tax=Flavobacterium aureirubrum TaxID=3133147 RepID=A0ABU9N5H5_9FLAO
MDVNHNIIPFSYFQDLLEIDKTKILINQFINDFINEHGMSYTKIDRTKGEITYLGQYYDYYGNPDVIGEILYDFESYFEIKIIQEKNKAKSNFIIAVSHIINLGHPINEFLEISRNILTNLELSSLTYYSDYLFIKDAILELSRFVAQYDSFGSNDFKYSNQSFLWDNEDNEYRKNSLIKLYRLVVVKYKLIKCNKSDFFNAFSNGEVKYGLKWMHLTDNGENCKTSLVYFINRLQEENFITESSGKIYNDKICYVFRGKDGETLKNIKHSKSKLKFNFYQYDFIDDIINDLI